MRYENLFSRIYGTVIFIICFLLMAPVVYGQISSRTKIKITGRDIYNYGNKKGYKLDKTEAPKIVYSDRAGNISYEDQYYQRKRSEYNLATPFYIIDERNGAYRLVEVEPDMIGKPQGLLGFLYNKNHFKDSKKVKYSGWISKENLLAYNHAILNTRNNLPIRFRVGTDSPGALFNLDNSFQGDSLIVYNDPFLRSKQNLGISNGAILYVYKYSKNGDAALISDKPQLLSDSGQIFGWVPSNMITLVGQNEVVQVDQGFDTTYPILHSILSDTIYLSSANLQSPYLFLMNGNRISKSDTVGYSFPISVWDKNSNKLININGGDIKLSDIRQMEEGMRTTNVHLIFYVAQKEAIKSYINSLQNLYLTSKGKQSYQFSATAIDQAKGNYYLPLTEDFSKWIEFISSICSGKSKGEHSSAGLSNAIVRTMNDDGNKPFENNIVIVVGANEQLSLSDKAYALLAIGNARLLFVQTYRSSDMSFQDFLLEAKSILDTQSAEWTDYISDYIVDNILSKLDLFKNIDTPDANLYLYDFPENSLSVGGVIFSKGKGSVTGPAFDRALDSIIAQTSVQDSLLLSSLHRHEMKLGLLRSEPSLELMTLFRTSLNPDSLSIHEIDKHNISDIYFVNGYPCDSTFTIETGGVIFDSKEVEDLLQKYRALLPEFADSIGPKELKFLKKLYNRQIKNINRDFFRKILNKNSSLGELFTASTGILFNDSLYSSYIVKNLKPKKINFESLNEHYKILINKLKILERLFMQNRLEQIILGRKEYYFIPDNLIL